MLKKTKIDTKLFLIGASGYSLLEILWRGRTHWTMALTGGACFTTLYHLDGKWAKKQLWEKCLLGSGVITLMEFVVGCIVNRLLKWDIWDYRQFRGNILGQVCPLYSALWALLSLPLACVLPPLRKKLEA